MGAKQGNITALRHGTHSFLATGKVGSTYLTRTMRRFVSTVESIVLERRGEVSLFDAATIQSAARHETICQLLLRYMKKEGGTLTIEQRLAVGKEIRSATDARDRCLKALGLDQRDTQADDLYGPPIEAHATEPGAADDARS